MRARERGTAARRPEVRRQLLDRQRQRHAQPTRRRIRRIAGHAPRARAALAPVRRQLLHPLRDRARRRMQLHARRDVVEPLAKQRRARQAALDIALERGEHDRIQRGRTRRVVARRRHDLGLADAAHRLEVRLRREQRRRGDQLPRDHARREHVGRRADGEAERRLRRHVAELAFDLTALGVQRAALRLRDAEVDHLQVPGVREDQVRRRDVAVHDAERGALLVDERVRVLERLAELDEDRQQHRQRDRLAGAIRVAQEPPHVEARDELHRDVIDAVDPPEVVDLGDVRMHEQRRDLRLAHERLDEPAVLGEMRQHALERDRALVAVDAALLRAIDRGHAADPEPLVDEVRAELLGRGVGGQGHGYKKLSSSLP